MDRGYVLTYDFGTGSMKAALVDGAYHVLAWDAAAYPMYFPEQDFAEQRVEDYWHAFCQITKGLLARTAVKAEEIDGIVISQTACTMIFTDEEEKPLNDCVTWLDNRAWRQAAAMNRARDQKNWTYGKRIPAKMRWFIENNPELLDKADYLLDVSAYLFLRLTGETGYDITSADTLDLVEPVAGQWNTELMEWIGMRPSLLPSRILNSFETVGMIRPEAGAECGLAAGTPVMAGCCDNANGQLGAGCIHNGDAHLYLGSSGWLAVTTVLPAEGKNIKRSAIPRMGYYYYCTNSVGTSIDYLISSFYTTELNERPTDEVYGLMGEEVRMAEAENAEILFLPFLYGEEEPVLDSATKGTLLNLKADTTRGQIARGVLEGVAFNFRWIKEKMEQDGTWHINFLRAIGGGAQSDSFLQILADVLEEPVSRLENARIAGNMGLAACVRVGLGQAENFEELVPAVKTERIFYPRKELRNRYLRLYSIYRQAYYALQGVYMNLNATSLTNEDYQKEDVHDTLS